MSSAEEPGSPAGLQAGAAAPPPTAKPGSRGPGCQVCQAPLFGRYETRFKVCRTHREADEVLHNSKVQRFCQQCNTFHLTERFEGSQRSCREQLARHAERRRELRRARREAEQGRSSPSSEGPNTASRRRAAGSPQRYSSAPAPLPLSLLLPGPPAPPQPASANPDGSPPSKRQRAQSDALALLANMSVDQLHAPPPPPPMQQSDTQSETLKLPALLPQLQAKPAMQQAGAGQQGSPGAPAAQQALFPPILRSTLASTDSAATTGPAAAGAAAGWAVPDVPLHPLTRAPSLPGAAMQSSSSQSLDIAALAGALAAAASRQASLPAPVLPAVQATLPAAPPPQADLSLMLQQLLGQAGGTAPALPQQAGLQPLLPVPPPAGQGSSLGQLNSQMDTALLQLRQQAAQQLLMLEKKQLLLRRTMDVLQHVVQQPAPPPPPLAAQPSGSLDALQLLALLQQQQPQAQPSAAQQQSDALLRMLGLTQPQQ